MKLKQERDSERARKQRSDRRVRDVALNRKKAADAFTEEVVEEAFDWVERGGLRRLWTVIKVIFGLLLLITAIALVLILDTAA
ncbi:hypothetical protein KX928_17575 [Roseobacter sp. YSTF-M11]|uniref:Uncharacterized protein n=1 Tax=Roseobacter insulae TaxID=2859783 RepID=A0A9X1FYX9_9RHOB|nr:hypothetical protein [Roseobacter insulae]MBW4709600.1 hypothetical protein [Roseobacter insulae]